MLGPGFTIEAGFIHTDDGAIIAGQPEVANRHPRRPQQPVEHGPALVAGQGGDQHDLASVEQGGQGGGQGRAPRSCVLGGVVGYNLPTIRVTSTASPGLKSGWFETSTWPTA